MLTIFAALLLAAPAHGTVNAAATAIQQGKWRCGFPDPVRKTCRSLARYTLAPDGDLEVSVAGVPGSDGLTVAYRSRARIEEGEICTTITREDLAKATFTKAGVVLVGDALSNMRGVMIESYASLLGHKICDRDQPPGSDGLSQSLAFVDGEAAPDLNRPVKWVDAKEGYVVGPMPDDVT